MRGILVALLFMIFVYGYIFARAYWLAKGKLMPFIYIVLEGFGWAVALGFIGFVIWMVSTNF